MHGTLVPLATFDMAPSEELLNHIRMLSEDPNNAVVCIVSGRERGKLEAWFASVPGVALLAEHGYWYKAGAGTRPLYRST